MSFNKPELTAKVTEILEWETCGKASGTFEQRIIDLLEEAYDEGFADAEGMFYEQG